MIFGENLVSIQIRNESFTDTDELQLMTNELMYNNIYQNVRTLKHLALCQF